jgi:hypothetical protein
MSRHDGLVGAELWTYSGCMLRSRFCRSAFQLFVVLAFLGGPAFSQGPESAALPSQTAQTAAHTPAGAASDCDVSLRALPKNSSG